MKTAVTYRMVAGRDFIKLANKMIEQGEPMPNLFLPTVGFIAEDENGEIVGHVVLQTIPIVEPMKAEDGYGECLETLFGMMRDYVHQSNPPRVLMHTSHRAMKKMLLREDGVNVISDEFFQWEREEPVVTGTTVEMAG